MVRKGQEGNSVAAFLPCTRSTSKVLTRFTSYRGKSAVSFDFSCIMILSRLEPGGQGLEKTFLVWHTLLKTTIFQGKWAKTHSILQRSTKSYLENFAKTHALMQNQYVILSPFIAWNENSTISNAFTQARECANITSLKTIFGTASRHKKEAEPSKAKGHIFRPSPWMRQRITAF